ncbi:uncharacterized protein [Prorops nasuta]|uniref:uncharacterized protein n=1 Tax=Prorops nasuta TaxID=863751 RepID=UPI0034D015BD
MNYYKSVNLLYPDGYLQGKDPVYYKDKTVENSKGVTTGTAKMKNEMFSKNKQHNHDAEKNYEKVALFKKNIQEIVANTPCTSREAYNASCLKYPEATSEIPFSSIKSSIYKWKQRDHPCEPKALDQMFTILNNENWQKYLQFELGTEKHTLKVHLASQKENMSIILIDEQYLHKFTDCITISVDATYKTTPNIEKCYQFLTVMGEKYEKVFPFIWVLMNNKSASTYTNLFSYLKSNVLPPSFKPNYVHCDFELALHNSLKSVFSECNIIGCYFHYVQAVRKMAKKLKIIQNNKRSAINTEVSILVAIRKICYLPLLPSKLITTGLNIISVELQKNLQHYEIMKPLINYVESFWIRKIGPEVLSVFNFPKERTNNAQERYHRTLHSLLGTHPPVTTFLDKLMELIKINLIEYNQLAAGNEKPKSNISQSTKIFNNWLNNTKLYKNLDKEPTRKNVRKFLIFAVYKN